MTEANRPTKQQFWICVTCGHKSGGPLPQPALCREPSCPASRLYSGGRFGGVLKALPRETDMPIMAEMRKSAPDHRYENDDQILDSWVRSAELGMQLPTWELKWFAKVFQEQRERLPRREITESLVGTGVTIGFLWLDYHWALWFHEASGGEPGGCPWPLGMFFGALLMTIAIPVLFVIPHVIGEAICNALADRGLELRPKVRSR